LDVADRIDVALDEMSAHAAIRANRPLQIHQLTDHRRPKRRHAGGFRSNFRMYAAVDRLDHRQAHAVDRETVAGIEIRRERRPDPQPRPAGDSLALDDAAKPFNESGEHIPRSWCPDRAPRRAVRAAPSTKTAGRSASRRRRDQSYAASRTTARSRRRLRPTPRRAWPRRLRAAVLRCLSLRAAAAR